MCTLFVYTYVIDSRSSVTCVLCLCIRTLLKVVSQLLCACSFHVSDGFPKKVCIDGCVGGVSSIQSCSF